MKTARKLSSKQELKLKNILGVPQLKGVEKPLNIQYLSVSDVFSNVSNDTAVERRPLRNSDVWVDIGDIPLQPPLPAPFPGGTIVGSVRGVSDVVLVAEGSTKFTSDQFIDMVPSTQRSDPANAYRPVLADSKGRNIIYDPAVWIADSTLHTVQFKGKSPEQLGFVQPLTLTYWRYVGRFPLIDDEKAGSLTLTDESNQLTLGTTTPVVINTPARGAGVTVDIPDPGITTTSFVLADGSQTLGGDFTFTGEVKIGLSGTTSGSITTTDATPTTLLLIPISDGQNISVNFTVTGLASSSGITSIGVVRAKNISGTITIIAVMTTKSADALLTSADVTFVPGSNAIALRVIGIVATTVNWKGIAQFV